MASPSKRREMDLMKLMMRDYRVETINDGVNEFFVIFHGPSDSFWFTRPVATNACQKAFVTDQVGDFGLLLGILGFYWITGSFEFRDMFEIVNNLIYNNEVNVLFVIFCAVLLFTGAVAKSAQFPLHVWLPDAMEGPTPISALIHAATMVVAGIFLVARLLPLFTVIPFIMSLISFIGIITVLLGATSALTQKDIKRGLAYSTMSQLEYMMLALGPYHGGQWKVKVELPDGYPYKSPSIVFVNKIYHPNIDEASGAVCLDVINQTWSPMFELVNVFEVFLPQLLLYPNPSDPLNGEAGAIMMRDRPAYEQKAKEYCERYAKAKDVGAESEMESSDEDMSEPESYSSDDEAMAGPVDP